MSKFKLFLAIFVSLLMVLSMASIAVASTSDANDNHIISSTDLSHGNNAGKIYTTENKTINGFSYTGKVSGNTMLNIVLYVPVENQSVLTSLANDVSSPGSAFFNHYMTHSQIEKEFYNVKQYDKDKSTLNTDGFTITGANDPVITAQGNATQVSQYLGLKVNYYSNGTSTYYYGFGTPTMLNTQVMVSNMSKLIFSHPTTLVGANQIASLSKIAQKQNETLPLVGYSPKYLETVYNATTMYKEGYNGTGQTIGILDFGGDPYIKQQLSYYDHEFNVSAPPHFNIVPIGPYKPVCGIFSGWAGEISLDVEASHTMAPGANITLYIANLDCNFAPVIASIDAADKVNDLSQSFSVPESDLTSSGAYFTCEQETNTLYAIGSLEGITFSASSGDTGASGFSTGPLGTVGYPATSPYVTSVGGTSTYLDFNGTSLASFYQTAWSNYGFVPPEINYGGSTGGISYTQPIMPYQNSSLIPKGFPDGKLVPDLSFEATIYPGFLYVMPGNVTEITGGTSEASPILAGLITLADQELGHKIGMLEPTLYYLGEHDYNKVFIPVTSGYNIPFTDHYGYNLVNGWGSLNISGFANAYKAMNSGNKLSIFVESYYQNTLTNESSCAEYQPGQTITVTAYINSTSILGNLTDIGDSFLAGTLNNVNSGTFHVSLVTLDGNISTSEMSYNKTDNHWTANVTMPSYYSGPAYFEVYGSNGTKTGENVQNIFEGDFLNILAPASAAPFSTNAPSGLEIEATLSYLNGTLVEGQNVTVSMYSYSIMNNTYYKVYTTKLVATNTTTFSYAKNAILLLGNIPASAKLPDTVSLLKGESAYAYLPFMNGPYLQDSVILGPNIVEPGAVGAGQYIYIDGSVEMPLNEFSSFGALCSNVTFSLYSPDHKMVSSAEYNVLDNYENPGAIPGLYVPVNSTPGLYTILINSTYYSSSNDAYVNGSFYGQIYVTNAITPEISINAITYEGQNVTVKANIEYPNGTEVKYGMYSAAFYPALLDKEYYDMTEYTQVALNYNSTINQWVGHFKLPSQTSDGSFCINYEGVERTVSELPPGLYDVYVSGISANAYPTTTSYSAQKAFEVEPQIMIENQKLVNIIDNNGLALQNDKIQFNGDIENSIMLQKNYIDNSILSLTGVSINGTLYVNNSTLYLNNTLGLNIVAHNSTIVMESSYITNLNLESSKLYSYNSAYKTISPAKPNIDIISPSYTNTYTGNITMKISVTGNDIAYTQVLINNHLIYNTTSTSISFKYDTYSLQDGTYNVTVESMQTDGISVYNYTTLNVNNSLDNISHNVNKLSSSNSVVYDIAYVGTGLGALGSGLGVFTLLKRRK